MRYLNDSHDDMHDDYPGFMRITDRPDVASWRMENERTSEPTDLSRVDIPRRWTRRIVIATAAWSMIELPFELWVSVSTRDAIACVTAKVLWVALAGFVLGGSRLAGIAYTFLCAIGLLAVAFSLPVGYRVFPLGFAISSVECLLKAIAIVCLVSAGGYSAGRRH